MQNFLTLALVTIAVLQAGPVITTQIVSLTSDIVVDAVGQQCLSDLTCSLGDFRQTGSAASATVKPTNDIITSPLSLSAFAAQAPGGFGSEYIVEVHLDELVTITGDTGSGTFTLCPTGGVSSAGSDVSINTLVGGQFGTGSSCPSLFHLALAGGTFQFTFGVPFDVIVSLDTSGSPDFHQLPDQASTFVEIQLPIQSIIAVPEPSSFLTLCIVGIYFAYRRVRASR